MDQDKNPNAGAKRPLSREEYVEQLLRGERPSEQLRSDVLNQDIFSHTDSVHAAEEAEKPQKPAEDAQQTQPMEKIQPQDLAQHQPAAPQRREGQPHRQAAQRRPVRSNPAPRPKKTSKKSGTQEEAFNLGKEIRDWVVAIAVAVIVALLIRNFVFTLVKVQGQSMEPTLQSEDRLYVNRFLYTPEKNDIVIFVPESDPDRPYIKRVIATEGDSVYIDFETGDVYVNDELLDEPYIKEKTRTTGSYIMNLIASGQYSRENPIIIEQDKIFVMGDNRNNSKDSRELGQIPLDEVLGGAVFRFWPINNFGSIDHKDTALLIPADEKYGL